MLTSELPIPIHTCSIVPVHIEDNVQGHTSTCQTDNRHTFQHGKRRGDAHETTRRPGEAQERPRTTEKSPTQHQPSQGNPWQTHERPGPQERPRRGQASHTSPNHEPSKASMSYVARRSSSNFHEIVKWTSQHIQIITDDETCKQDNMVGAELGFLHTWVAFQ